MEKYFSLDKIYLNENFSSKEEFLTEIGKRLSERGEVEEGFINSIIEREKIYPTGLCFGNYNVAIPHTNPEFIKKEGIVVVKFENSVIFRDMGVNENDLKVNLAFVLLVKKGEEQVELLMKLMNLFEKEETYNKLMEENDKVKLLEIIKEKIKNKL